MFCVVYQIKIKKSHLDRMNEFIQAWADMTNLIKEYEGGLGSRLHKVSETEYLAYAQWPDRVTWENAGGNLPDEANKARTVMQECYESFDTIHTMDMVKDMLVHP